MTTASHSTRRNGRRRIFFQRRLAIRPWLPPCHAPIVQASGDRGELAKTMRSQGKEDMLAASEADHEPRVRAMGVFHGPDEYLYLGPRLTFDGCGSTADPAGAGGAAILDPSPPSPHTVSTFESSLSNAPPPAPPGLEVGLRRAGIQVPSHGCHRRSPSCPGTGAMARPEGGRNIYQSLSARSRCPPVSFPP